MSFVVTFPLYVLNAFLSYSPTRTLSCPLPYSLTPFLFLLYLDFFFLSLDFCIFLYLLTLDFCIFV